MITREQALTASEVHSNTKSMRNGTCYVFARNGKTHTWVTRPAEFRMPIKNFGLRFYGAVTQDNNGNFHTPEDCPLLETEEMALTNSGKI